jgi:exopolysaccharide biosynthesis protein
MIKYLIVFSIFFGLDVPNASYSNNSSIDRHYKYNVIKIKKGSMNFGVSSKKPKSADFYINSNFFTNRSEIGLTVIDGKVRNRRVNGGGFFYVKNNRAFVQSKNCPKDVKYASQTILWAYDNGKINKSLLRRSHANKKRYRTLMGQNKSGDIVVISSNVVGFVTISEIVNFSKRFNIVDGILLDGGSSVDYKFKNKSDQVSFSIPSTLKKSLNIKEPTTYIYGNFN